MGEISLMRHAESDSNAAMSNWEATGDQSSFTVDVLKTPDWLWDITKKGKEQAAKAAIWRKTFLRPAELRFSSPSPRAISTSKIVHGGLEPTLIVELLEQNWGDLSTKLPSDVQVQRQQYNTESKSNPDARPPNGETFREVCARVTPFANQLRTLVQNDANLTIDVSCHFGVRRALMFLLRECTFDAYSTLRGVPWKSNNCQIAVFTSNAEGKFSRLINVSPAVEDSTSFVTLL